MSIHASDNADIDLVIRNYVVGMVSADESLLRQAFHPACRIIGHYHGDLEWLSLDDFVAAIKAEGPAPSDMEIQSVDVTGDAAAVKIIDDYTGMRFTDYLSLLQIDGSWVIINKLYFYHA